MGKRATTHNGRTSKKNGVFSTKHNDRNYDTSCDKHIDSSLSEKNWYWHQWNKEKLTFDEVEARFYEKHFRDKLDATNDNYKAQRHNERVKTMDEYRSQASTCPEETIYQIGTAKGEKIDGKLLKEIYIEHQHWMAKTFPNVALLDVALHVDEPDCADHIHERKIYIGHDAQGREMPYQNGAFEEMGIQPPHLYTKEEVNDLVLNDKKFMKKEPTSDEIDKEVAKRVKKMNHDRHNNPKITFTRMCREHFIELCQERGIELILEPKEASKSGLDHLEYKRQQEEARIKELEAKLSSKEDVIKAYEKSISKLEETIKKDTTTLEDVKKEVSSLRIQADVIYQSKVEVEHNLTKIKEELKDKKEEMNLYSPLKEDEYESKILSVREKGLIKKEAIIEIKEEDYDKLRSDAEQGRKLQNIVKNIDDYQAKKEKELQEKYVLKSEYDDIVRNRDYLKRTLNRVQNELQQVKDKLVDLARKIPGVENILRKTFDFVENRIEDKEQHHKMR